MAYTNYYNFLSSQPLRLCQELCSVQGAASSGPVCTENNQRFTNQCVANCYDSTLVVSPCSNNTPNRNSQSSSSNTPIFPQSQNGQGSSLNSPSGQATNSNNDQNSSQNQGSSLQTTPPDFSPSQSDTAQISGSSGLAPLNPIQGQESPTLPSEVSPTNLNLSSTVSPPIVGIPEQVPVQSQQQNIPENVKDVLTYPPSNGGCQRTCIRRDYRSWNQTDWSKFSNAVLQLNSQNFNYYWNQLAVIHQSNTSLFHHTPEFLPWHRLFLVHLEQALNLVDPDVCLGYFDWSTDDTTQNIGNASIFTAAALGSTGKHNCYQDCCIIDGYFQGFSTFADNTSRITGANCVERSLNDAQGTWLSTNVLAVMQNQGYENFLQQFEPIHDAVHCAIGLCSRVAPLTLGLIPVSPSDPIFYFHHANVDRIWAQWQTINPDNAQSYPQDQLNSFTTNYQFSGIQIKQLLNISDLCYSYAPPRISTSFQNIINQQSSISQNSLSTQEAQAFNNGNQTMANNLESNQASLMNSTKLALSSNQLNSLTSQFSTLMLGTGSQSTTQPSQFDDNQSNNNNVGNSDYNQNSNNFNSNQGDMANSSPQNGFSMVGNFATNVVKSSAYLNIFNFGIRILLLFSSLLFSAIFQFI